MSLSLKMQKMPSGDQRKRRGRPPKFGNVWGVNSPYNKLKSGKDVNSQNPEKVNAILIQDADTTSEPKPKRTKFTPSPTASLAPLIGHTNTTEKTYNLPETEIAIPTTLVAYALSCEQSAASTTKGTITMPVEAASMPSALMSSSTSLHTRPILPTSRASLHNVSSQSATLSSPIMKEILNRYTAPQMYAYKSTENDIPQDTKHRPTVKNHAKDRIPENKGYTSPQSMFIDSKCMNVTNDVPCIRYSQNTKSGLMSYGNPSPNAQRQGAEPSFNYIKELPFHGTAKDDTNGRNLKYDQSVMPVNNMHTSQHRTWDSRPQDICLKNEGYCNVANRNTVQIPAQIKNSEGQSQGLHISPIPQGVLISQDDKDQIEALDLSYKTTMESERQCVKDGLDSDVGLTWRNHLRQSNNHMKSSNILSWNVSDVVAFVSNVPGCSCYAPIFEEQCIDGMTLLHLSEEHMIQFLQMKLGPSLRLRLELKKIINEHILETKYNLDNSFQALI